MVNNRYSCNLFDSSFFLGLWSYFQKKRWGIVLSVVSLGLAIQTDLTFLYLVLILLVYWIIFKPKIPSVKLSLLLVFLFLTTVSTLILTEIKLNFAGVKTLLNFSSTFKTESSLTFAERLSLFFSNFAKNFAGSLFPIRAEYGAFLAAVVVLALLYFVAIKNTSKEEKKGIYFLLLYLFAPAIALILGYHDKPWFLIGLPPAIALATGYAISKLPFCICR